MRFPLIYHNLNSVILTPPFYNFFKFKFKGFITQGAFDKVGHLL